MKYNLGTTQIQDSNGDWQYLKGMWVKQGTNDWAPVQVGWVCKSDGTWERIYPTPSGVFVSNVSSVNHVMYQNHSDAGQVISISNTGDYDLVIQNIVSNDNPGNYLTTLTHSPLPITIPPNSSSNIGITALGITNGDFTGNLEFTNYIGYFGYANVTIPVTANVALDFNGIGSDKPSLSFVMTKSGENNSTISDYSSGTTYTYTVPGGVYNLGITLSGGGGGGGATDSHGGSNGFPGDVLYGVIGVTAGDTLTFHIGGGGAAGLSGSHNYIAPGGSSDNGFSGGNGGPSGYIGWSGSGGSGGAATSLYYNNSLYAVAAGGGGGGGGGNDSYGHGQQAFLSSGGNSGGNAGDRPFDGFQDGGGAGGGGGGYPGGAAGDVVYGDNGSYSGRNGISLVPANWTKSTGTNGGAANAHNGGTGYFLLDQCGLSNALAQSLTIINTGIGANLNIASIHTVGNLVSLGTLTNAQIGYNFDTLQGNSEVITVTPRTLPNLGVSTDTIQIYSDAQNAPIYSVPVTITVV